MATKRTSVLLACLLATLSMSSTATAACASTDLGGTWYAYAFGGNDNYKGTFWNRCKLIVSSSGAVSTSSYCYDEGGHKVSLLSSSALSVGSACGVTGTMYMSIDGVKATVRVRSGQLSRDKTALSGVGTTTQPDMTGSSGWILTAVKQ
jgi:hypothetical protein